MNTKELNILSLAYLGDSVFELNIRERLIKSNIYKVNDLQTESLKYVTAKRQCVFINYFLDNNVLTDEEIEYVKRGRNSKVLSHPKSTDIVTYKWATGFESLFGYLYIENRYDRINELIDIIMEERLW